MSLQVRFGRNQAWLYGTAFFKVLLSLVSPQPRAAGATDSHTQTSPPPPENASDLLLSSALDIIRACVPTHVRGVPRAFFAAQLKRRLYWVIAGVLAAYWSREVLSMLIASPYASPLTLKMVAISSVYHVGKILLISLDARRQWSPTLGIMRLLMDHWHMSSLKDALLCAKRVSLQVRKEDHTGVVHGARGVSRAPNSAQPAKKCACLKQSCIFYNRSRDSGAFAFGITMTELRAAKSA